MAQRTTKADLRKDVVRLADGLDIYRDWKIRLHRDVLGRELDPKEFVEDGTAFLAQFDAAPGVSGGRYILRDLQTWYSVTADEMRWLMQQGGDEVVALFDDFREHFRAATGFDFFAEAGLLKAVAQQALKRGSLKDAEEWRLLKELRDHGDQVTLDTDEMNRLSRLMADFEGAQ